jgi:hypothetical protein
LSFFHKIFKTVRGFRHNVHGHIEHLKIIFDERRSDLESKSTYFILSSDMPKSDVEALRESITGFFTPSYVQGHVAGTDKGKRVTLASTKVK